MNLFGINLLRNKYVKELRYLTSLISEKDLVIRHGVPMEHLTAYTFDDLDSTTEKFALHYDCWPFAEWKTLNQSRIYYVSSKGRILYTNYTFGRLEPQHAIRLDLRSPDRCSVKMLAWLCVQLKSITVLNVG